MKKKIMSYFAAGLAIVPVMAFGLLMATPDVASAQSGANDLSLQGGAGSAKGYGQSSDLFGDQGIFRTITNVLLFLIGAIAVIMLIIGGIRYTTSNGDQSNVKAAKDTILYAIVGIVVAILAYAVVNWVIGSFASQ